MAGIDMMRIAGDKLFFPVALLVLAALSACDRQPEAPARVEERVEKKTSLFERADPIADGIRQQLARAPKTESNKQLVQYYEIRSYRPAWKRRARREQLIEALRDLRFDGLDPAHYSLEKLEHAGTQDAGGEPVMSEADRDILATKAYLAALLHLSRGKLARKQRPRGLVDVSKEAKTKEETVDLQWALAAQDNGNIEEAFKTVRPQHPVYSSLRAAMKRLLKQEQQGTWAALPPGASLKPGSRSPQIALLRERLAIGGYLSVDAMADEQVYDEALVEAVRQFQREQFLDESGVLDAATRAALNVPVEKRIGQMRVNLERARWQLRDLGRDFVLVDVTGYEVRYYRGAQPVFVSRVQVGEITTPTPMLRSEITHITFNPEWSIPPGMMAREILPILEEDPGWLRRNRIRVLDGAGNELDPYDIDWEDEGHGVQLKQDSGERGALGRAAIRFPNPHFVYMHETPHKKLFERDRRAFSNGCIRVEQILPLVGQLLGWEAAEVEAALAGGKTHEVSLPVPVPVLVAYWTVDLHENGRIAWKPDVYNLDEPTLRALNTTA